MMTSDEAEMKMLTDMLAKAEEAHRRETLPPDELGRLIAELRDVLKKQTDTFYRIDLALAKAERLRDTMDKVQDGIQDRYVRLVRDCAKAHTKAINTTKIPRARKRAQKKLKKLLDWVNVPVPFFQFNELQEIKQTILSIRGEPSDPEEALTLEAIHEKLDYLIDMLEQWPSEMGDVLRQPSMAFTATKRSWMW